MLTKDETEGYKIVINTLRYEVDRNHELFAKYRRQIDGLIQERNELKANTTLAHRILKQENERVERELFAQRNRRDWKC